MANKQKSTSSVLCRMDEIIKKINGTINFLNDKLDIDPELQDMLDSEFITVNMAAEISGKSPVAISKRLRDTSKASIRTLIYKKRTYLDKNFMEKW